MGSEEKAELARANGCDHTILYRHEDIPARVRAMTDGEGVAAAYDSVGKDTFMDSLDALRPFGVMVSYGNASGLVEPFSPGILAPKGSLYVTRPTLATHIATRELLVEGAERLFSAVTDASKVALACLTRLLQRHGFRLIDCQMATPHLTRLGCREIPRSEFMEYIDRWCREPAETVGWQRPPMHPLRYIQGADPG